jgi:predicted MFS family arabinose efflux permease
MNSRATTGDRPISNQTPNVGKRAESSAVMGATEASAPDFSIWIQLLLGGACGLIIANLYYAQPLTGLISASLGLPSRLTGLMVTWPLAGYGIGLLLIVPLGDLIENRRLVLTLVAFEALSVGLLSFIGHAGAFLGFAFVMGAMAAAVQVLVPYATYLAPEESRGKAVGRAVSGVMLGIMLARPVSSLVTNWGSWRVIFRISAVLMAALFVTLRIALPRRHPRPGLTYRALLGSMGRILIGTEVLRRRAMYHACMFGAFSVFWTAVPLWLSGPQFGLTQKGIAWVAFAGVAGAIAPPFAGRLADRGLSRGGTAFAMVFAALAFALSRFADGGSRIDLGLVTLSAIVLDFAVSANLVFGQRAIFALGGDLRSRLNGLFMALFFAGGAVGSAVSGWCYSSYGWKGASLFGAALPILGLLYLATERRPSTQSAINCLDNAGTSLIHPTRTQNGDLS